MHLCTKCSTLSHSSGCSCCILDYVRFLKSIVPSALLMVWNSYFMKTLLSIKKMHQNSNSENCHQTLKKNKKQKEGINNTTIRKGGTDVQTWRTLKWVAIFCFKNLSANKMFIIMASCLGDWKQVQDMQFDNHLTGGQKERVLIGSQKQ